MGMQQKIEKHWNSSADNYGSIIRRELDSFLGVKLGQKNYGKCS